MVGWRKPASAGAGSGSHTLDRLVEDEAERARSPQPGPSILARPGMPTVRLGDADADSDDPDTRLRIVCVESSRCHACAVLPLRATMMLTSCSRTATGSLHESIREDERRRVGKIKRKASLFRSKSKGGSLFPAASLRRQAKSEKSINVLGQMAATTLGVSSVPRSATSLGEEEQRANALKFAAPETVKNKQPAERDAELRRRRNVYVNWDLPPDEVDSSGQPLARWARNKVRTSKYTLLSFLPKVREPPRTTALIEHRT